MIKNFFCVLLVLFLITITACEKENFKYPVDGESATVGTIKNFGQIDDNLITNSNIITKESGFFRSLNSVELFGRAFEDCNPPDNIPYTINVFSDSFPISNPVSISLQCELNENYIGECDKQTAIVTWFVRITYNSGNVSTQVYSGNEIDIVDDDVYSIEFNIGVEWLNCNIANPYRFNYTADDSGGNLSFSSNKDTTICGPYEFPDGTTFIQIIPFHSNDSTSN